MSKKKKTRKQKERATARHIEDTPTVAPIHIDTPTYSVAGLKTESVKHVANKAERKPIDVDKADNSYLRHDISAITAASGIVLALEILLFVLLTSGVVKLNFLGY